MIKRFNQFLKRKKSRKLNRKKLIIKYNLAKLKKSTRKTNLYENWKKINYIISALIHPKKCKFLKNFKKVI